MAPKPPTGRGEWFIKPVVVGKRGRMLVVVCMCMPDSDAYALQLAHLEGSDEPFAAAARDVICRRVAA